MSSAHEIMDSSDAGGVGAKHGFLYQDYVASLYMTKMLLDKRLIAVRCEVTDDIDLIYNSYIEYVQVKSTDGDKKWTITEFCTTSKAKEPSKTGKAKPAPKDSILHKSLSCDKHPELPAKFRIVSERNVNSSLEFLTIEREKRGGKKGRAELVKSLSTKLGTFKSTNENGAEYWIDNAFWEVIPTLRQLELEAIHNITKAAFSEGILLSPTNDPSKILNDILCTITHKSAISRKINVAADKTYHREEFIKWFKEEIYAAEEKSKSHRKIYTRNHSKLKPILLNLLDHTHENDNKKICMGLYQQYFKSKYRFQYIAETTVSWLPELLLRPDEFADSFGVNLQEKYTQLSQRIAHESKEIELFVGKILLHATIRFYAKSQPIPAILYIDDKSSYKMFENVHIVPNEHKNDELWMGFSKLITENNIEQAIKEICEELDSLLTNDFDKHREKILDVKVDSYLIKHDINKILDPANSFDEYKENFRFIIFLGYNSENLTIEEPDEYKDKISIEVKKNFDQFISKLVLHDKYYQKLNISIYLYPSPCITTLLKTIQNELGDCDE